MLTDDASLQRIKEPTAWMRLGTDAAGRRQYLYHQKWQEERSEEKFDRVLQMSSALPGWRARVAEDLRGRGLHRDRVLALALHLLDRGYFRAGGEAYAEENNSYGIATLLCEHVTVRGTSAVFDYPAKSGVQRSWASRSGHRRDAPPRRPTENAAQAILEKGTAAMIRRIAKST